MDQNDQTVLFLGAGASAAAGGLVTDEILPKIYNSKSKLSLQDARVDDLLGFLTQRFCVPNHYPALPLLMSLIDTALDRRERLFEDADPDKLARLREGLELGIFDALEESLVSAPTLNHYPLLNKLYPSGTHSKPRIITTNYDLLADATLMSFAESQGRPSTLPDYHCGLANIADISSDRRFGTLLKLHGSLNWLQCKTCLWLGLGRTESLSFNAALQRGPDIRSSLNWDGQPCPFCQQSQLRPLLVAPSHLKDYRNPHLGQVWYHAQQELRRASKVVFVGYSMPDDDVEVIYLLKRSLAKLTPKQITVVSKHEEVDIPASKHEVGRRYQAIFGTDIDWHAGGLEAWLSST